MGNKVSWEKVYVEDHKQDVSHGVNIEVEAIYTALFEQSDKNKDGTLDAKECANLLVQCFEQLSALSDKIAEKIATATHEQTVQAAVKKEIQHRRDQLAIDRKGHVSQDEVHFEPTQEWKESLKRKRAHEVGSFLRTTAADLKARVDTIAKEIFAAIDVDASGTISKEEFLKSFGSAFRKFMPRFLQSQFADAKPSTWEEVFVGAEHENGYKPSLDKIYTELFNKFDVDRSGTLNREECKNLVLQSFGELGVLADKIAAKLADDFVADQQKTYPSTSAEALRAQRAHREHQVAVSVRAAAEDLKAKASEIASKFFTSVDVDASGSISKDEFLKGYAAVFPQCLPRFLQTLFQPSAWERVFLGSHGHAPFDEKTVDVQWDGHLESVYEELFNLSDKDHSGTLTKEECKVLLLNAFKQLHTLADKVAQAIVARNKEHAQLDLPIPAVLVKQIRDKTEACKKEIDALTQEVFSGCDVDGNGSVSKAEFVKAFGKAMRKVMPVYLHSQFENAQASGWEKVFIGDHFYSDRKGESVAANMTTILSDLFVEYDQDRSGSLSVEECKRLILSCFQQLGKLAEKVAFRHAEDKFVDDVTAAELKASLQRPDTAPAAAAAAVTLSSAEKVALKIKRHQQTAEEVRVLAADLSAKSDEIAAEVFATVDLDHSATLSKDEFVKRFGAALKTRLPEFLQVQLL